MIVVQFRIASVYSINLFHLPRRQLFPRIKTPAPREHTLPAQHLVQSGDTSGEITSKSTAFASTISVERAKS
jgi:hypothetical protein